MSTHKHTLPCRLTEREWRERSEELARTVADLSAKEAEAKAQAAATKQEITKLRDQIVRLGGVVTSHEEPRLVDCEAVPDLGHRTVQTIRLDTGEVVSSRPMTETEELAARQGALQFGDSVEAHRAERARDRHVEAAVERMAEILDEHGATMTVSAALAD